MTMQDSRHASQFTGNDTRTDRPTHDRPTRDRRLWRGGGDPSLGCLCAMQEMSWQNGDLEISAHPAGVTPLLAMLVQEVNDRHCTHTQADPRRLCHDCSETVRTIASRTRESDIADDQLTCTIYLAIAHRLGLDDPDLRRRSQDHPFFLAREITGWFDSARVTPELVDTVADWWADFVHVRTGRIVGISGTWVKAMERLHSKVDQ